MVQSAVINEAIVFITVLAMLAVLRRTPREKRPQCFRYFTVLSNLFCALTALILLLPLFCVIALLIKTTSPGPVFFSQIRVGQYGRHFRFY